MQTFHICNHKMHLRVASLLSHKLEDTLSIINIICKVFFSHLPSHLCSLQRKKKWIEASWEPELSSRCVALNFYRPEAEMLFMATTNLGLYTQWKPTVNISFMPLKEPQTVNVDGFLRSRGARKMRCVSLHVCEKTWHFAPYSKTAKHNV